MEDQPSAEAKSARQDVESKNGIELTASEVYIDPVMNKKVLRRLDRRLAPLFSTLYFLSYLDRSNIGNAAIAGMNDQLGLTDQQYSAAVSVFFATYISFIPPLTLALRFFKPHRAITAMAFGWAVVTLCTGFVRSYKTLLVCRVILGMCEAGFFPCISLYMTMVYNREEQGQRIGYVFIAAAGSSMFGGLIATGITKIGTVSGLQAWSWLYIIEGLISLLAVPWTWFGLPDTPVHAKWWTEEERKVMDLREIKRKEYMGQDAFDWKQVFSAMKEWRCYTGLVGSSVFAKLQKLTII